MDCYTLKTFKVYGNPCKKCKTIEKKFDAHS